MTPEVQKFLENLNEWNGGMVLEPHQVVSQLTAQFPDLSVTDARMMVEQWNKTRFQLLRD